MTATNSATGGGSSAAAAARSSSSRDGATAPGAREIGRRTPVRSVMSASRSSPSATLRYQSQFVSRRPGSTEPSTFGIG